MIEIGDEPVPPTALLAQRLAALEEAWWKLIECRGRREVAASAVQARSAELVSLAGDTPKIAELARTISRMIAPVASGAEPLTGERTALVQNYLDALAQLPAANAASAVAAGASATRTRVVYVLEPDPMLARELAHQIEQFGYQAVTVRYFGALRELVKRRAPHAVVMDVRPQGETVEVASAAAELRAIAAADLALVLLSDHGDLASRLLAARAGADAYLVKPFDLHQLIDELDNIGSERAPEPFQIVIVEDSNTQATYYAGLLRKAGMVPTVVNDPLRLLDVLSENACDLILMDMYLPRCNGEELAKVVRQFPRYASIPIVYLSGETAVDRQLDALSGGGDDFLTKPIDPGHLIRSVTIRAERARILRTFMLTDNLTGLLNHTRIKEQLQSEVARALRSGAPLSFAMLDIDHFKTVNDTHGHPVGDRVIKTLARVLRQRLRIVDYIGRYGGEEFAAILVDVDLQEAVEILDRIRESFGLIRQSAPGEGFTVTFSGGVASFPASADAVSLALDADRALYAAKKAGRNRIVAHRSLLEEAL